MSELNNYTLAEEPEAAPDSLGNSDELSLENQEALRFKQDTKHRQQLVCWMMCIVSIWLFTVLLITAFNIPWCLGIDKQVLITLLATTTVNVLGLSRIVLNGLFGSRKRKRNSNNPFQR